MSTKGVLYIVATPIGNLEDISIRAIATLRKVDFIAAEDTRHSHRLMQHYGIETRMQTYHDHSGEAQTSKILRQIDEGASGAIISDAGTPLISDPGFKLVREARAQGYQVTPIPGACALISALSAAGLPTDRFSFEGFLSAKTVARINQLTRLEQELRTMVFYESPHRIQDSLSDMEQVFGSEREVVVGRELTKTFETFLSGTITDVRKQVEEDPNQRKGEIVVMVHGAPEKPKLEDISPEVDSILVLLLEELSTKKAAVLAEKLTGVPKKRLYNRAVELKNEKP